MDENANDAPAVTTREEDATEREDMAGTAEAVIIDETSIRDKIYEVRGVEVMLDFELAEMYGYETKSFNRQVKNNAERFEGEEFMFQLTRAELEELSRCKKFTSIQTKGVKGGRSNLPYAFTEQGVYLLMTVLRGDLAVRQSRALVMAFKAMKDYIVDTQGLQRSATSCAFPCRLRRTRRPFSRCGRCSASSRSCSWSMMTNWQMPSRRSATR